MEKHCLGLSNDKVNMATMSSSASPVIGEKTRKRFFTAVREDNDDEMANLLQSTQELATCVDGDGCTALFRAAENGCHFPKGTFRATSNR